MSDRIIDGYRLEKRLGAGAQGHVYRAVCLETNEVVAMKLYEIPVDEKDKERTRRRVHREFNALQSVSCKSVVRAIQTGEFVEARVVSSGYLWTAFEFVTGRDVSHGFTRAVPTYETALGMFKSLAVGLNEVHKRQIIHRDIKPENVILRGNKWTDPVLVDFGYARPVTASRLTKTGMAVGTSGFIAPEVLKDPKSASPLSDQWSLGRLVSEVLLWIQGHDVGDLRNCRFTLDDVFDLFQDSDAVQGVIAQALSPEDESRFDSSVSFVEALERALYDDGLIEPMEEVPFVSHQWDRRTPLLKYLETLGYTDGIIDNRNKGGALWVIATQDQFQSVSSYLAAKGVNFTFAPNGGRATGHQPAWHTKAGR